MQPYIQSLTDKGWIKAKLCGYTNIKKKSRRKKKSLHDP